MTTERLTPEQLIEKITNDGLASLRGDVEAGRARTGLVSLDERGAAAALVTEQYSGRYPLELIQNANDAAAATGSMGGRVRLELTEDALLAADEGAGFGVDEINAICGLARTSKDPRKTIGYKGLGFKSVREITDTPQIVSNGVRFTFDRERLHAAIEAIAGELSSEYPNFRVPDYAFPFRLEDGDLGSDAAKIGDLRAAGYRTVCRLPLRNLEDRAGVADLVATTVIPRVLLFLDSTETLEVMGAGADFSATAVREVHEDHEELLLEVGDHTEQFLVFRRQVPIPDRELVSELGPGWQDVEAVRLAIAVPLDADGRPQARSPQPVHVYFPTEEQTGLSLILNADFQVELDRRRILRSPHAEPYNQWLKEELVSFVAETVVPALADRFNGVDLLMLLAQQATPSGFGAELSSALYRRLRSIPFLPCRDGMRRLADDAALLPSTIPDAEVVHASLPEFSELLDPAVESRDSARALLTDALGVREISTRAVLAALEPPPVDLVKRYYEMLLGWSKSGGFPFGTNLKSARCVRLRDGAWVRPADPVFFPQQRDEVEFPIDLGIPIADLPEIDDLADLLSTAGVRQATWRELIPQFLVPRLADSASSPQVREQALAALRRYYDSVRRGDDGDRDIRAALPRVLLPAQHAATKNGEGELRPTEQIYFGFDWLPTAQLEALYGPFGQPEFLGLPAPHDEDGRTADLNFYRWLGVADRPRIVQVGEWDLAYRSWRSSETTQAAMTCTMGHPQSQRLDSAPTLDRLASLAGSQDEYRLTIVWQLLAEHWSDYQQGLFDAQWRCVASAAHRAERVRHCPSPGAHLLSNSHWVPAERDGQTSLERPDEVWRPVDSMPKAVLRMLCRPTAGTKIPAGMAETFGLVDAGRPSADQIVALLEEIESRYSSAPEMPGDTAEGAHWLLRKLDELVSSNVAVVRAGDVPLVATVQGRTTFSRTPYLTRDETLREIWADELPLYRGDYDLRALLTRLELPVLDDQVAAEPVASIRREDVDELVGTRLAEASPALLVVAAREAPSRVPDIAATLRRIASLCSDDLQLRYSLPGRGTRIDDQSSAFIDTAGRAYLRVRDDEPDWWEFGLRLARLVNVQAADAFAILLGGSEAARRGYFNARRVSAAELAAAQESYLDAVDESDAGISGAVGPGEAPDSSTSAAPVDADAEDEPEDGPALSVESTANASPTARTGMPAAGPDDSSAGNSTLTGGPTPTPSGPKPEKAPADSDTAGAASTPLTGPSPSGGPGSVPKPTAQKSQQDAVLQRFYSFVAARGSERADEAQRQDGASMALGNKGVEHVLAFERAAGREPTPQAHNNKGFDVISQNPDGTDHRIIEIKATENSWPERGIPVSNAQIAKNLAEGDSFWLYVVEHVNEPDKARVIPIQNPAASIDYYVFDSGWEQIGQTNLRTDS